ncbi:MAG: mannose-1-phosphate guanylyltransferase/mannose-6-phosphate isomerase [Candidatus Parcubacteria bacterium]|nr:mannose-1-phosphate guanylyltransferase/mannose-6-phosphate isomerase [Candidatus Parcubacteria bacterium]
MNSVILCGGSGTRLWPLSRKNYPKQFLNLYSDKSLLQETFLRMRKVMPAGNIFFVTNKDNYYNVYNQTKEIFPTFSEDNIILEPTARNTLPAVALAVKYLREKKKIPASEPILFAPSDHFIQDCDGFAKVVKKMSKNVGDYIGTIGITPLKPETGYGYIQKGKKLGSFFDVVSFKEKPNRAVAEEYIASGEYLWNSGMYMFNAKAFVGALKKHVPQMAKAYEQKWEQFSENFSEHEKVSIDNGISEKSDRIIVFEGNFGWSDIGSFDSLADASTDNKKHTPRHVSVDSKNIFVHTTSNKLVATLGVEDLVIIESNGSILVHKRGRSEEVKKMLAYLEEKKYPEVEHNILVHRPWGKYEVLIDTPLYKVKKITVYPGAKLSYQSHEHRSEHWVVVEGVAMTTIGNEELPLHKNQSTFIPAQTKHRLANFGKVDLKIVEVQTGVYLGEDDIKRYDDIYKRI